MRYAQGAYERSGFCADVLCHPGAEVSALTPYAPVTVALLHDLRLRGLSWADRGVVHHLYLLAGSGSDGKTVHVIQKQGEAVAAAWERALGKEAAGSVGRAIEAGLVEQCPEGLRITIPARGPTVREGGALTSSIGAEDDPQGKVSWQGKPSNGPSAERARNDRKKFKQRVSPFGHVAAGVEWERWVETAEGAAFVARREQEFPGYRLKMLAGTAPGTGTSTAPVPPRYRPPLSPSHSPSFPGKEKEDGEEVPPAGTGTSTAPRGGTSSGLALLDAMREASNGRATLDGDSATQVAMCAALVRLGVTGDEAAEMGAALADTSAWWTSGSGKTPAHVTLHRLRGYYDRDTKTHGWEPLQDLVAYVRGEAAKRERRERTRGPAPQSVALLSPEAAQRLVDEARASGGLLARKKESNDG